MPTVEAVESETISEKYQMFSGLKLMQKQAV